MKARGGPEDTLKALPCLQVDSYQISKISSMFKPEHLISQEEPGAIERMVEICAKKLSITGTFLIIFHGRTFGMIL